MGRKRRRLAERRRAVGLSQERLAEVVGVDRSTVVRWERADTEPQPWHRPRLASALRVSIEQLAALLADIGEAPSLSGTPAVTAALDQVQTAQTAVASELMRRRALLGYGAAVAGPGVFLPGLALEAARHGLVLVTAEEHGRVSVDEWREIIDDHGRSYLTIPPEELLQRLAADAVLLQRAVADHQCDDTALDELRRIGAALAAITALALSNLGRFIEARRWWRSARHIAHGSGDVQTVAWVCGHEIVRSLYEGRSPAVVMRLTKAGEEYSARAVPTARPRLIAGKAQALAMVGRAPEAEMALNELRDTFAMLPADATRDDKPLINTPESRLRHTESFVYAYLGDTGKAERAQRQALALSSPSYPHARAQIELLRALCQVRAGDVPGGIRQAQEIMSALAPAERIRSVIGLGHKVLEAVPVTERRQAVVADFHAFLATPSRG